jgi:hypothetical protein
MEHVREALKKLNVFAQMPVCMAFLEAELIGNWRHRVAVAVLD